MPEASIRKIQILTDSRTNNPLFYCHADDVGHDPRLLVESENGVVHVRARRVLFKVKKNPQNNNRVDIYMGIDQARQLGSCLLSVVPDVPPRRWEDSKANPQAAAKGNMKLPNIVWQKFGRSPLVGAQVDCGLRLRKYNAYINVDLEYPDETHIKMAEYEIHLGISLGEPSGAYDVSKTNPVNVPEHELQKRTKEKNPVSKVQGDFYLRLLPSYAAGLGELLTKFDSPA